MNESPESNPNHLSVSKIKPLRVLCLDGGGMRGIYSAAYLHYLAEAFAKKRGVGAALDIGASFDLICGTSTGAIIGCALALGIDPGKIVRLYETNGPSIFKRSLPSGPLLKMIVSVIADLIKRPAALKAGEAALRKALEGQFGNITLGEVYESRKSALAIPAIDIAHHRSWVFKTPHIPKNIHRDDAYRLVDVCLATSAAPLYRSLAAISDQKNLATYSVFVDGGLWANNPVLVGMIDALQMAQPNQSIERVPDVEADGLTAHGLGYLFFFHVVVFLVLKRQVPA